MQINKKAQFFNNKNGNDYEKNPINFISSISDWCMRYNRRQRQEESDKSKKTTKTAVTTVAKDAFAGSWDDAKTNIRPIQLRLWYDEATDSYSGEVATQVPMSDLHGKVKGNTLYLTSSKGRKAICTLKGDKMHIKAIGIYYGKTINTIMEQR